jgi:hypothetical protein
MVDVGAPVPRAIMVPLFVTVKYLQARFTSPRWGEVDLRSKSGAGMSLPRETTTPHPNPLQTGEGADFSSLRKFELISSCISLLAVEPSSDKLNNPTIGRKLLP